MMLATDSGPGRALPVPAIDAARCRGSACCVRVCPTGALVVRSGCAIVAFPDRCSYCGDCEAACPTGAISLPFEVSIRDP